MRNKFENAEQDSRKRMKLLLISFNLSIVRSLVNEIKSVFSSEITAEKVVELFHAASNDLPGGILPGKVAVKLHSGEPGNQNFLKPEFWQPVVNVVHGTVVECNTAYDGGRNTTENTT